MLQYLPSRIARCVQDHLKAGEAVEEICLHRGERVLLVCAGENRMTDLECTPSELQETFLALCEGSIYAHGDLPPPLFCGRWPRAFWASRKR